MSIEINNLSFELKDRKTFCVKHNEDKVQRLDGRWACRNCTTEYNREYTRKRKEKHAKELKRKQKTNVSEINTTEIVKNITNNSIFVDTSPAGNPFDILVKKAFIDNDKDSLNAIIKVALEKLSNTTL